MTFFERPPPLRIKSTKELERGFRPRWVKLRTVGLYLFLGSFLVAFVFATLGAPGWFVTTAFVATLLFAQVLIAPKPALALLGLGFRHFPTASKHIADWQVWLEFDLDWNDQRR
ncbi:MAG: hypothetical protein AAFN94_05295 [Pseudomonadota bacterium]